MSTTSTDLINDTKRILYSGAREAMNKLNGALTNSTTDASFLYELGMIQGGVYLGIDLEILYVWTVQNVSTKLVTVERGMLGSTAATHADGSVVTVNPKFSDFTILDTINGDLVDLSSPHNGLFKEATVTLTYSPAVMGYDLTGVTDLIDILEVKYDLVGPAREWPEIRRWELRRQSDTGDFASGLALVLYEAAQPGRDVRVTYAAPYGTFTALGQNIVTQTGLQATAFDIPPLGAAAQLQSFREGQRNFNEAQGDTRRAAEVPVGAQLAGVRGPDTQHRLRIMSERSRLRKRWPYRRRVG